MTSVKRSLQPPPCLPLELWIGIIGCICQFITCDDLTYLWTECRNISKLFRQEVERVFVAKHLPKTRIQFNLGKKPFHHISTSRANG